MQVSTHKMETGRVRVTKSVQEHEVVVQEPSRHEEIEIERVPVDRFVAEPIAVRYEGDTMIIPVMEEVVVVETRLRLKEELRVTSIAELLAGLVSDLKVLAVQEFRLATNEFQEELGKAKREAILLALGVRLTATGGILLIFMMVHMLAVAELPLSASHGLLGGLLVGSTVYLLMHAKNKASDIHIVPLGEENMSWIKEEVKSARPKLLSAAPRDPPPVTRELMQAVDTLSRASRITTGGTRP